MGSVKYAAGKNIGLCILIILLVIAVVIVLPTMLFRSLLGEKVYETNDVDDYLNIVGNYNNETPKAFVQSFFPTEIKNSFSSVEYHYKAKKGDTYAYEVYLEFVLEDKEEYQLFVSSVVDKTKSNIFVYDQSFFEYTISHEYEICKVSWDDKYGDDFFLETAEVGKILYSDEEQRLIFVAIGMFDGGGAHADEFDRFLNRFDISPKEFATSCRGDKRDMGTVLLSPNLAQ